MLLGLLCREDAGEEGCSVVGHRNETKSTTDRVGVGGAELQGYDVGFGGENGMDELLTMEQLSYQFSMHHDLISMCSVEIVVRTEYIASVALFWCGL